MLILDLSIGGNPELLYASKILFGATASLILGLPIVDNPETIFIPQGGPANGHIG